MTEPADDEVVRRARLGDGASFGWLVDRYADDLFRIAYSMLGNEADARDVVQETFLGAYRRIGSFAGRAAVRTWLIRILFNQVSKARRSRRVRKSVSLGGGGDEPAADDPSLHHQSPAPAADARADVAAMLATLSDEYRQVIILRELQRLSYDEIAAALSVPVGTVESRLHRARQELKRRFGGYAP